jgi:outer membrane receptor for monomeric catechols
VEILTLNGFGGDDTFTLTPAISASPYQTMNLNGGGQASATGDRVYLVGTSGADDIHVSGQWSVSEASRSTVSAVLTPPFEEAP